MIQRDITEALALVRDKGFWSGGGVTYHNELEHVTTTDVIEDALMKLVSTSGPSNLAYKVWEAYAEQCNDSRGLTMEWLIPKWVRDERTRADEAYYDALEDLDDKLSAFIADCVFDALTMAGVTDRGRCERIVRTVLQGGPELPDLPEPAGITPGTDPLICPHCAGETDPGQSRCIHCERLIG